MILFKFRTKERERERDVDYLQMIESRRAVHRCFFRLFVDFRPNKIGLNKRERESEKLFLKETKP